MKKTLQLLLIVCTISTQGQNKLLSSIGEYYVVGSWENSSGHNYQYDSNNNLISETYLSWQNGVWKNSDKTSYTYATTNTFVNSFKITFTYTNGMLTETVDSEWSNSSWLLTNKTTLFYNSNNLPDNYLSYTWNGIAWVAEYKGQLYYNSNNNLTLSIEDKWGNTTWKTDYRNVLTYNANNKIIIDKHDNWDGTNWIESERSEYQFDATGNRTVETNFYNSERFRREHSYDASSLMSSFANPFKDKTGVDYVFRDFPYVNKLLTTTSFNYNSNTSSYEMSGRTSYNYNSSITLANEKLTMVNDEIIVFPNPTKHVLNFQNLSNTDNAKVIVTDVSGKTVLRHSLKTAQIDVQNLAKGIYVLQLISGDKKQQFKFIKE
jgi:hypothetical protein